MNQKKFWVWKNQSDTEERTLELYGAIAEESWFDDDITPQIFRDELNSGAGPVTVWINSPGGDCIAASQIYSALIGYPDKVTVKIDGIAASAASVIAMAGDRIFMAPTAVMMIHNPATEVFGDKKAMKDAIDMLETVKNSILDAYELKSNLSRDEISKKMDATTWMDCKDAIAWGFADGILEKNERKMENTGFDFSSTRASDNLMKKMTAKYRPKETDTGREISALLDELKKHEIA